MVQLYVIVLNGFGFSDLGLASGWSWDPTHPDFMLNLNGGH